jgi:hypothetical protein
MAGIILLKVLLLMNLVRKNFRLPFRSSKMKEN